MIDHYTRIYNILYTRHEYLRLVYWWYGVTAEFRRTKIRDKCTPLYYIGSRERRSIIGHLQAVRKRDNNDDEQTDSLQNLCVLKCSEFRRVPTITIQ